MTSIERHSDAGVRPTRWQRAIRDTIVAAKDVRRDVAATIITAAVGAIVAYVGGVDQSIASVVVALLLGGLAGLVLLIIGEFAVNAVRAPLRIEREVTSRLEAENELLGTRVLELEREPKPHLRFVGVDVDREARIQIHERISSGTRIRAVADRMSWARVHVANDPGNEPGETAAAVVATVRFLTPDGNTELLAIDGRWAEAPQAPELTRLGLSKEGRAIDIEANGDRHPLDVAMKYEADPDCFAYNNDNGLRTMDARYENHRLVGPRFLVAVSVKGGNTPRLDRRFILDNPGVGLPLSIAPEPGSTAQ